MEKVDMCEKAAGVLKVIAHPVRLRILDVLRDGYKNVTEVQKAVNSKQSVTSQNLNALADKGVLGKERRGNEVFYFIKKKEVLNLLACITECCQNG